MNARRIGLVILFSMLGSFAPLQAQTDGDRLVEEVAGLNRSLERLVVLLEQSLANQQVDLLLKRIDLKERRLAPLESELRDAEQTVQRTESELERMAGIREQQERQVSQDLRDGTDSPDSEARRMMQKIDAMVEFQNGRLEDGHAQVQKLEDELAEGREEIKILEDQLAELLER